MKRKKENLYLFFLLIFIPFIFSLGCINPGSPKKPTQRTTGNFLSTPLGGLSIEVSVSNQSQIYSNSPFSVIATIKNDGDSNAENVKVKLERMSGDFTISPSGWQSVGEIMKPIGNKLMPVQIPWTVTAGDRGGDLKLTVEYEYTTNAEGDIVVYNMNYVRSSSKILQQALNSPGILSFKGTRSPITVSVYDQGPIYYRGEANDKIIFYIDNSGNGLVYDKDPKQGGKIRNIIATIKVGNSLCKNNDIIQLNFVGKTAISCTFNSKTDSETTIPFNLTLKYVYVVSKTVHVNVNQL